MRTYDPADCIHYVHMAAGAAVPPAPPQEECHELPADYANASLRDRIGPPRRVGRPALVLLSGGSAPDGEPAPVAPALSLAR
jgi:hypothetical protein